MPQSRLNLEKIAHSLSKRSYKLADIEDKIVRVAFDVVRFKNDEPHKLWEINHADDGDYIIATYEEGDELVAKASQNPWDVVVKNASDLNVFYKKDFVLKLSAEELGFEKADVDMAQSYLPRTLASDKSLVGKLISSLDGKTRSNLLAKHPELS